MRVESGDNAEFNTAALCNAYTPLSRVHTTVTRTQPRSCVRIPFTRMYLAPNHHSHSRVQTLFVRTASFLLTSHSHAARRTHSAAYEHHSCVRTSLVRTYLTRAHVPHSCVRTSLMRAYITFAYKCDTRIRTVLCTQLA